MRGDKSDDVGLVVGYNHGHDRSLDTVDQRAGDKHQVGEVDLEEVEAQPREGLNEVGMEEDDLRTCRSVVVDEVFGWNKAVGHRMEVFWMVRHMGVGDDYLAESHHLEWLEESELVACDLEGQTHSHTVYLQQVSAKVLFHPEVQACH